jgi:hypothetical protein
MRVFTLLIVLYLALDVSNPFLPGALTFDPDESVEVVQLQRLAVPALPEAMPIPQHLLLRVPLRVSVNRPSMHVQPVVTHAVQRRAADPPAPEEG